MGRYHLKWSGGFLKYGDNLASPRTFDLFNGRKIIIREITGKYPNSIIATYSEDIYLFNMSNIAIIEKENTTVSLKYILAILNSQLMSYYFVKNTAKSVRKLFPKLQFNLSSTSSSTKFNRNMKTKCFPIMLKFVGFWSFLKIKL